MVWKRVREEREKAEVYTMQQFTGEAFELNYSKKRGTLDRSREFSVDQLKGKQVSLTFRPDALVVFMAKISARCTNVSTTADALIVFTLALKTNGGSGQHISGSCFPLSWSTENPPTSIILEPAENRSSLA